MPVKSFTAKSLVLLPPPRAVRRSFLGANTHSCVGGGGRTGGGDKEGGLHEEQPEIRPVKKMNKETNSDRSDRKQRTTRKGKRIKREMGQARRGR